MQSRIFFFRNSGDNHKFHLNKCKEKRFYTSSSNIFSLQNETSNTENSTLSMHQIDYEVKKIIRGSLSNFPLEKESFQGSKCLIPLSIGQTAHYGAYLAATLNRVEDCFSGCTFLLGDTLQRHTIPLHIGNKFSEDFFYKKTLTQGNQWIEKNAPILASLKIPYSIIRWDYWLNHKRFKLIMAETEALYKNDIFFKQSVEQNIEDYIARLKSRGELSLPEDIARNFCLKYIIEECAAMRLWSELQCQYDLYPNKRSQAMEYIYEKFIKIDTPDLLKPISIRFKKKEIPSRLITDQTDEMLKMLGNESQSLLKRI